LRAPTAKPRLVPVFTSEELSALRRACQGTSFAARRDAAIIEVLLATGVCRAEVAGIGCDPGDPARGDLNLLGREIRNGGKARPCCPTSYPHADERE
jgi:site-specific recombinase XerD